MNYIVYKHKNEVERLLLFDYTSISEMVNCLPENSEIVSAGIAVISTVNEKDAPTVISCYTSPIEPEYVSKFTYDAELIESACKRG